MKNAVVLLSVILKKMPKMFMKVEGNIRVKLRVYDVSKCFFRVFCCI